MSFPGVLFHMCKSGHLYPNPTRGDSGEVFMHECEEGSGFQLEKLMTARDIEMEDISNVFFDTITGMSNIWHFKLQ
jgi:hypothetical protein